MVLDLENDSRQYKYVVRDLVQIETKESRPEDYRIENVLKGHIIKKKKGIRNTQFYVCN